MTNKVALNRRTFLAANAAVAAAATVPSVASAAATAKTTSTAALAWNNATSENLMAMVGERFRISSPDTGALVMELVAVEPIKSGGARPSDLTRSEGVIAVFDSPDKAPIVECGCGVYRVSHPRLGAADLYLGPSPLRYGGHVLELVLN